MKYNFLDLLCVINEVAELERDVFLIKGESVEYIEDANKLADTLLILEDSFRDCIAETENFLHCKFAEEEFKLHLI